MSLPKPQPRVYRKTGLLFLLTYATLHTHSRRWIPAITLLLRKGGDAHG
jgi:hypothetical protein